MTVDSLMANTDWFFAALEARYGTIEDTDDKVVIKAASPSLLPHMADQISHFSRYTQIFQLRN